MPFNNLCKKDILRVGKNGFVDLMIEIKMSYYSVLIKILVVIKRDKLIVNNYFSKRNKFKT